MINIGLTGEWKTAARILGSAPVKIRIALDRSVLQEAQFFRTKVVEGFREQAPGGQPFRPLSPFTLAVRRFTGFKGTKALIVRGDLRNSVKVVKKQTALGAEAFVGVLKNAKGKRGQNLFNVARVHEFGSKTIVQYVTPKQRKFLMAAIRKEMGGEGSEGGGGGGLKTGIIVSKIPPRPFIGPVVEKWFNNAEAIARFHSRAALNLRLVGAFTGFAGRKPRSVPFAIKRSRRGLGRAP